MIVKVGDKEFYMDRYLVNNLDYVKKCVLEKTNMCTMIIDGRIGSGKSTLGAQIAYYCSGGKASLESETFTPEQFTDCLKNVDKGGAAILDEAFALLNRRKSLSSQNMIMLSMMQQARIKQCFIFIILPSFYDLDKNLVLNIADFLIHCYRKDFGRRGQYAIYDRQGMIDLWLNCRQTYSYNPKVAKPNFKARFTGFFPFDSKGYDKKKMKALEDMAREDQEGGNKYLNQRNKLISVLKESGKGVKEIAGILGMGERMVYKTLKKPVPP
jgi:hypothetical protein|tara:strand:- start:2830 stop:3636 length:807 start_codon:yes stop_codon:yes gene_type:complete